MELTTALSAEPTVTQQPGGAQSVDTPVQNLHCHPLIARLTALARQQSLDIAFQFDAGPGFPVIEHAAPATLPAALLAAFESVLIEIVETDGEEVRWLLTQVLALRLAQADLNEAHGLHWRAMAHASQGEQSAPEDAKACWQSRRMELDLALATRLGGAARLLMLRHIGLRHAAAIERGEGRVLKVWIEVLLQEAQSQLGDYTPAKLASAAAFAERLRQVPDMADEGQYLLATVLLRRAGGERGDARTRTLAEAQVLLDTLFARTPSGRFAMAVAEAALARGRDAPPAAAKLAFTHALSHAFIAGCDPCWHAASLQCRLAIQLAYESLPEMSPQGQVALDLARKLEQQPLPPGATIEGMVQTFISHGEYARACRLCARAWLAGARFPTLAAAWEQAGASWESQLAGAGEQTDWQDNERQRRIAAQWQ